MADKDKKKLKVILKLPKPSSSQQQQHRKSPTPLPSAAATVAKSGPSFAFAAAPASSSQISPAAHDHRNAKNVQAHQHGAAGGPLAPSSFASVRSSGAVVAGAAPSGGSGSGHAAAAPPNNGGGAGSGGHVSSRTPTPSKNGGGSGSGHVASHAPTPPKSGGGAGSGYVASQALTPSKNGAGYVASHGVTTPGKSGGGGGYVASHSTAGAKSRGGSGSGYVASQAAVAAKSGGGGSGSGYGASHAASGAKNGGGSGSGHVASQGSTAAKNGGGSGSGHGAAHAPTPPKKRKFKTVEQAGALRVGVVGGGSAASSAAGDDIEGLGSRRDAGGVASRPPIVPPALSKKSHKKQVKLGIQSDGPPANPFAGMFLPPEASVESLSKSMLEGVLDKLQKKDTYGVFAEPVDAAQVPDYYDIISEPMDFGTMRKKIKKGSYTAVEAFEGDIYLICSNAMRYNGPETIYYKQARSIRDMARKALEGIRAQVAGDIRKPSSHKKKAPPLKKTHSKKPALSKTRYDGAGVDFASAGALAVEAELKGWSNSTVDTGKAKKGVSMEKLVGMGEDSEGAWAVQPAGIETKVDTQEEPSGAPLKPMGPKDGRRPLSTDEYHRNTYKQRLLPAHGQGPPLAAVGGELRQLVHEGSHLEYAYAKSLAQFGASLGSTGWRFVARKLQKVLAPSVPFGPGWVGEHDAPAVKQKRPVAETPSQSFQERVGAVGASSASGTENNCSFASGGMLRGGGAASDCSRSVTLVSTLPPSSSSLPGRHGRVEQLPSPANQSGPVLSVEPMGSPFIPSPKTTSGTTLTPSLLKPLPSQSSVSHDAKLVATCSLSTASASTCSVPVPNISLGVPQQGVSSGSGAKVGSEVEQATPRVANYSPRMMRLEPNVQPLMGNVSVSGKVPATYAEPSSSVQMGGSVYSYPSGVGQSGTSSGSSGSYLAGAPRPGGAGMMSDVPFGGTDSLSGYSSRVMQVSDPDTSSNYPSALIQGSGSGAVSNYSFGVVQGSGGAPASNNPSGVGQGSDPGALSNYAFGLGLGSGTGIVSSYSSSGGNSGHGIVPLSSFSSGVQTGLGNSLISQYQLALPQAGSGSGMSFSYPAGALQPGHRVGGMSIYKSGVAQSNGGSGSNLSSGASEPRASNHSNYASGNVQSKLSPGGASVLKYPSELVGQASLVTGARIGYSSGLSQVGLGLGGGPSYSSGVAHGGLGGDTKSSFSSGGQHFGQIVGPSSYPSATQHSGVNDQNSEKMLQVRSQGVGIADLQGWGGRLEDVTSGVVVGQKQIRGMDGGGVATEESAMNMGRLGWTPVTSASTSAQEQVSRGVSMGSSGKGVASSAWNTAALMQGLPSYANPPVSAAGRDDASAHAWAQARVMSLTQQAEAMKKHPNVQGFHQQGSHPQNSHVQIPHPQISHLQSSHPQGPHLQNSHAQNPNQQNAQLKLSTHVPQILQPQFYADYNNLVSRHSPQQSAGMPFPAATSPGMSFPPGSKPVALNQQPDAIATVSGGSGSEQTGMLNLQSQVGKRPVPSLQQSSLQKRAMPPDLNVALLSPSALQSPSTQQGSTPTSAHQPDLKLQL